MHSKSRKSLAVSVALSIFLLGGCSTESSTSGLGQEDLDGVIEACSMVYQLDWTNVTNEMIGDFANKFVATRNLAVSLSPEANEIVQKVADLVRDMDDLYDEARDFTQYEVDFSDPDSVDALKSFNDIWQTERDQLGSEINRVCEPYFLVAD